MVLRSSEVSLYDLFIFVNNLLIIKNQLHVCPIYIYYLYMYK